MTEDELAELLKNKKKQLMPSVPKICEPAIESALGQHAADPEWIKLHFSDLVNEIEAKAYKRYLDAERQAATGAVRDVIGPMVAGESLDFIDLYGRNFHAIDKLHMSFSQGRKARAGSTFERIIKRLFTLLQYPYAEQQVINGKPDFLLPSRKRWDENPMDCIIFTVKRTLRERWRQITTEGTDRLHLFLGTIDTSKTANDLREMLRHRIYLVVPESLRQVSYSDAQNVISFEVFFEQHLDPAMERWRKNGVI